MDTWHIITSEYPPQQGGVSDHTQLIARALADAGDEVHVWCPALAGDSGTSQQQAGKDPSGVVVHRELGGFTPADLKHVGNLLDRYPGPRRLWVQWVPHGYGYRSMNLAFCFWLRRRAVNHHDVVEVMVHEPYLAFLDGSWKQTGVATVHRLMTIVLLKAARRVWMSIPGWETLLRPYAMGRTLPFSWLPIASNIAVVDDPTAVKAIRDRYTVAPAQIVGHFGTYDRPTRELLMQAVPALLGDNSDCILLLLGYGSEQMRRELVASRTELAGRIHAAGSLSAADLSIYLGACDVMLQPYIDGASTRRSSLMAGLSHGRAIATTSGRFTEPLWAESEAVALAPALDIEALVKQTANLLHDETSRRRLSASAKELYTQRFAVQRIVVALREPAVQV